jgi:uncharacterized Zn-binding protein involved in type VI secretion
MVTPGTPPVPHVGGPVLPAGAPTVLIGGLPAARMGDRATCVGPPDSIIKGAFPVPISNNPAARLGDQTAHGGVITVGCPTVLIGLAGTAGNVRVGTDMCNTAAGGRGSGTTQQSYNNCGVESSRQVINRANNSNLGEDQLLQTAIDNSWANGTPGSPPSFANGGTNPATRQSILANAGVASTVQSSNATNLGLAMSRGQGVIASLDAAPLWGGAAPAGSLHAVTVTGVEYDDNGNVTNVIINDTGTGLCGQVVPIATWNSAVGAHPSPALNVTTNPIF